MTNFVMRIGSSTEDEKIAKILKKHEGFSTATGYVKAAILDFHNRNYLKHEIEENVQAALVDEQQPEPAAPVNHMEQDLLRLLMENSKAQGVHREQVSVSEIRAEIDKVPDDEDFIIPVALS